MVITLWILVVLLTIIIILLAIAVLYVAKKATYLSRKDKDFLEFTVDMYVNYAEELNINDPDQHEIIVKQLDRIKKEKLLT